MQIKKIFLTAIAVFGMAVAANATSVKGGTTPDSGAAAEVAEHDMNVYGANYTDGDKFEGLTRKIGFDRMIPPHALEVCVLQQDHAHHLPGRDCVLRLGQ